jgi:uncharacterized caspase-like protein
LANYGISIGINDYIPPDQQGLRKLDGAIKDAELMNEWMIKFGGVPEGNAFLLKSTSDKIEPIKDMIDQVISDMVTKIVTKENADADRFYFYFSGHGIGVELDSEINGLCMANWTRFVKDGAALSTTSYKKKFINEGLFKEVIMWLDCCRNTKVNVNPAAHPGLTQWGTNRPNHFVGFATQYQSMAFEATKKVTERTDESRGIFTEVLLKGLAGAAQSADGRITADSLRDYLKFHTPVLAQESGFLQDPEVTHNASAVSQMYFS